MMRNEILGSRLLAEEVECLNCIHEQRVKRRKICSLWQLKSSEVYLNCCSAKLRSKISDGLPELTELDFRREEDEDEEGIVEEKRCEEMVQLMMRDQRRRLRLMMRLEEPQR
ncbi:hypothetical protein Taro_017461 [Colocasia esculenta]|uniref:Uncharacterized protein n=1 Tax=Colocasia esculenta TaxID=4460 RepID=A0A843UR89_COLES|nr:hypothetical protein [Colocasia esculenta]